MKTSTNILSLIVVLFFFALPSCEAENESAVGDLIGKLPFWDRVKKEDPQLDEALDKLVGKVVTDGQINTKVEKPYTQVTADSKFYSWKACARIPLLNVTCVESYVSVNDLTIGARLTSDSTPLLVKASPGPVECVTDAKLLGLVTLVPALMPFKPLIDRVIRLLGALPAQMLSVCLKLSNFQLSKTSFSGCVVFDANLACWKGKCAYKTSLPLGCFNLAFTMNGPKLVVKAGQVVKRRNLHFAQRNRRSVESLRHSNAVSNKFVQKRRVLRKRV
jgi:hypothetical protein